MEQTKFESDLEAYFPEIYKLHQLGKLDKWVWKAIYSMLEFSDDGVWGDIRINYQRGKINHIFTTRSETIDEVQATANTATSEKTPKIDI